MGIRQLLKYVRKFENVKATSQNLEFNKDQLKKAYNSISNKEKSSPKFSI